MSTQVVYNGILMEAVKTRRWERTVVRTPDRTDDLHARYVFEWELMLARDANSYNQSATAQSGFAPRQSWDNIKEQLLARGKSLKIYIGGGLSNLVFESPNPAYTKDAANGPFPLYARILRIDGDGGMIVSFGIETLLDEAITSSSNPLVSHRWQMIHDVDGEFLTVLQWRGQAIFGTDLLANRSADLFRAQWFPPKPIGFKRERANVELSSDNRIVSYHIVDREQVLLLGHNSPATRLTGCYTTMTDFSAASTGQPAFAAHVRVAAVGPKNVSREQLLVQAIRLANAKLEKARNPFVNLVYMVRATYAFEARQIELEMGARLTLPPTAAATVMLPDWRMNALDDAADIAYALFPYGGGAGGSEMPNLPRDGGTRGTFIRTLQAQIVRNDLTRQVSRPPQLGG